MNIDRYLLLGTLWLAMSMPTTAQILIPATSKTDATRSALEAAGQRPDPFSKVVIPGFSGIKVKAPPPPTVGKDDVLAKLPVTTTPVALSVLVKGFIVTDREAIAIVSREGNDDIARVGDTILSAQVIAISPVARTVTLKENGEYVVRSLETSP